MKPERWGSKSKMGAISFGAEEAGAPPKKEERRPKENQRPLFYSIKPTNHRGAHERRVSRRDERRTNRQLPTENENTLEPV